MRNEMTNIKTVAQQNDSKAHAAPEGWQLVPETPTTIMLQAGSRAAQGFGTPLTRTEHAYCAMLDAAPRTIVERKVIGWRWRFLDGKDKTWRYQEKEPNGDIGVVEQQPLFA